MVFKGMSNKIPAEFIDVQLCQAMKCTYWELMEQPARHVELYTLYLQVEAKVREEENKKLERQANKSKGRVRRR